MIAKFRRSLTNDQFGQALILGVACLLVLAVVVMGTAQMGWAVKQRIQLQHAADNSAYTTAVMVARSLNMISWTNRAIIAQYVSAMAFQSYMGFFDGLNTLVAQVAAMLLSIGFILGVISKIPIIGWFVQPFATVIGIAGGFVKTLADKMLPVLKEIDVAVAAVVRIITKINKAMFVVLQYCAGRLQTIWTLLTNRAEMRLFADSIGTARATAQEEVDKDGTTSTQLQGLLNQILFNELFDTVGSEKIGVKNANANEYNEDTAHRAERLMAEISNASRAGWNDDGQKSFEVGRGFKISNAIPSNNFIEDYAKTLIDKVTPTLSGGTLLAEPKDKKAFYADDADATKNALSQNPVTNSGRYYVSSIPEPGYKSLPRGTALISTDFSLSPKKDWPGFLEDATDWFSEALGEFFPRSKVMGIQATADANKRFHCRFQKISMLDSNMEDMINDLCEDSREGFNENRCNDSCKKYCRRYMVDDQGNQTSTCALEGYEPNTAAQPDANVEDLEDMCGKCQSVYLPDVPYDHHYDCDITRNCPSGHNLLEDEAREKVRDKMESECRANAAKMANMAGQAAAELENNANQALADAFNGFPAKVYIKCYDDEKAEHGFDGIAPYASFNIDRYNEKQRKGIEPYPFFLVRLTSKPSFLSAQNSALGFGDAYGKGKSFKVSTMGKVSGPGASNAGKCNDGMGFSCKKAYNFNYISNGEMKNPFGEGFNAWASSGVYYHRPGTWAEPPNMFNPYWKAKLKPVAESIDYLIDHGGDMENGSDYGARLGSLMQGLLDKAGVADVFSTIMAH